MTHENRRFVIGDKPSAIGDNLKSICDCPLFIRHRDHYQLDQLDEDQRELPVWVGHYLAS